MSWRNGLYLATSTETPDGLDYTLLLRVDLQGVTTAQRRVSADLYRGRPPASVPGLDVDPWDELTHLGSYCSKTLDSPAFFDELDVTLPANDGRTNVITLALRGGSDASDPHYRVVLSNLGMQNVPSPMSFSARPLEDKFLRRLYVECDREEGTADPFGFELPENVSAAGKRLSFTRILADAGFRVIPSIGSNVIPLQGEWSIDQLASLIVQRPLVFTRPGNSLAERTLSSAVYLLVVGRLQNAPNVAGIMFDRQRRGAAVFHGTLKNWFGGTEFDANYLFTLIHELGHCLNLPHSFDASTLLGADRDFPTFMNYPQNYGGLGNTFPGPGFAGTSLPAGDQVRYQNFWKDFAFGFHPVELLELRHGALRTLETGTDAIPYRGDFGGGNLELPGTRCLGAALSLRVRKSANDRKRDKLAAHYRARDGGIFEFGEPVHVEVELESLVKGPREVSRPLSVVSGDLEVFYRTPRGRFEAYRSPIRASLLSAPRTLDADPRSKYPGAFHNDICLSFAADGQRFLEPGMYYVRAAYRWGRSVLLSNVLKIFVRYPRPQIEDAIVPLLDDDINSYFSTRGVHGLERADRKLDTFVHDACPRLHQELSLVHPLAQYYFAYEAEMALHKAYEFSRDRIVETTRNTDAISAFQQALGIQDLKGIRGNEPRLHELPFSNIVLSRLLGKFGSALTHVDRKLASALARQARASLKSRGVPAAIVSNVTRAGPSSNRYPKKT